MKAKISEVKLILPRSDKKGKKGKKGKKPPDYVEPWPPKPEDGEDDDKPDGPTGRGDGEDDDDDDDKPDGPTGRGDDEDEDGDKPKYDEDGDKPKYDEDGDKPKYDEDGEDDDKPAVPPGPGGGEDGEDDDDDDDDDDKKKPIKKKPKIKKIYKTKNKNFNPEKDEDEDTPVNIDTLKKTISRENENRGGIVGFGGGQGETNTFSSDFLKPKTNWKNILKTFISGTEKKVTDWNRPNKRVWGGLGIYLPSSKKIKSSINIAVAIDTSASIEKEEIHAFLSEIAYAFRTAQSQGFILELSVLFWMTNVYKAEFFDNKNGQISNLESRLKSIPMRNDGGTYISSVKTYIDSNKNKNKQLEGITGIIYLTDGYIGDGHVLIPNFPKDKVLFLITPIGRGGDRLRDLEKFGKIVDFDSDLYK